MNLRINAPCRPEICNLLFIFMSLNFSFVDFVYDKNDAQNGLIVDFFLYLMSCVGDSW